MFKAIKSAYASTRRCPFGTPRSIHSTLRPLLPFFQEILKPSASGLDWLSMHLHKSASLAMRSLPMLKVMPATPIGAFQAAIYHSNIM